MKALAGVPGEEAPERMQPFDSRSIVQRTTVAFETSLTTEQLGGIFKAATQAMHGAAGRLGNSIRGMGPLGRNDFEYYKPEGDQFAELDSDPPTFVVGVTIPTFTGTNGGSVTLHMCIWDRGGHRSVELSSPHGVVSGASKSKKRLGALTDAFRSADPSMTLTAA
jgi:hypothetical protein